jgi:hypothetical protein
MSAEIIALFHANINFVTFPVDEMHKITLIEKTKETKIGTNAIPQFQIQNLKKSDFRDCFQ